MKVYYLIATLLMAQVGIATAQSFTGKAIYKYQTGLQLMLDSSHMSPTQMQALKAQIEKQMQKEYTLSFNTSESSWKEVESLNGGPVQASSGGMEIMVMDGSADAVLYKNLSETRYERNEDVMGKSFIVKDSLKRYSWKLTQDTKKIGRYTCQKAVYEQVVDSKVFTSEVGEMENVKDTIETIAWFAQEIPVSHGPDVFYGLPGLILELKSGKRTYICTEIAINPAEKVSIERPKKGKEISRDELKALREEKVQEMMKRYNGGGDNQVEIRIGG